MFIPKRVLVLLGVLLVLLIVLTWFPVQIARVQGASMAPTLSNGDKVLVNRVMYRWRVPRPGDIVMLYYPLNPDKTFVDRIVAQEFDRVQIVDGRVYVNDQPVKDDYVPSDYRSHDDYGPTVVPEGYYFVLGDHRNNSSDSRHWGFVPKKYIVGRVQARWWPHPAVF